MKIGVIGSAYNCAEFLNKCLEPWESLKNNSEHEFYFSFIHNCFKENRELGFDKHSQDQTDGILKEKKFIDSYVFSEEFLTEAESRNVCLKNMKKDVDYVWTLGFDELFTKQQINKCIEFVSVNPLVAWFKINYKNYIFDGKSWIDGFCPPRIFNNRTNGGISELYYDDDFLYKDGSDYKILSNLEIPKSIAHIKHMTWLHSNGKAKVEYQKKRWGENGCGYSWNNEANMLEFNSEHYERHNLPLPILNYDE